jgi:hypothetical protein
MAEKKPSGPGTPGGLAGILFHLFQVDRSILIHDERSRRAAVHLTMRVGATLCLFSLVLAFIWRASDNYLFFIAILVIFCAGVFLVLYTNLLVNRRRRVLPPAPIRSDGGEAIRRLEERLAALQRTLGTSPVMPASTVRLDGADLDTLARGVTESIGDSIIKKVKADATDAEHTPFYRDRIMGWWKDLRERLEEELFNLSKRANVSLFIGCVTSLLGIGLLVYFAAPRDVASLGPSSMLVWYSSRLPVVVFIEVFSYFFLRLYRVNLEKIEYFQNEMTNVDSKAIALLSAVLVKDKNLVNSVVSKLAQTERNFRLKKGERTIALLREEMEARLMQDSRKYIASLMKQGLSELNGSDKRRTVRAGKKKAEAPVAATDEA